ncbi:MAG TPA: MraY family glycosyltransferase [Ktedonobacteraceae bacterium]|nr:MraY family glycosyltransferase [Ktedonobacteraceae bacterium]
MFEASIIHIRLLLLIPINLPDAITLLIGGASAFVFAFVLTFLVKAFCYKVGWLDKPAARRVHTKAVPRLGGVAMFLAFAIASLLFYTPGPNQNAHANELTIYWLLIAAGALMVIVHAYDDVLGLSPWPKLLAQTIAVIIILGPWINGVFHGVLLFTFNNPFGVQQFDPHLPWYREPTLFLVTHTSNITLLAIPAVLLTWFWTVGMMNTINWIDGMDGLATGVVGITALFITLISFMLHQYSIAILSAIFTGAVFGFLPHNWNPAKIFMGDSGSMFLGLALAVLSIMGGAKLALALMVLGVPILDVAVVIMNRIRRGQSPVHYDKTHLHHRLMSTGLSVKQICYLFYGLAFVFGLLALSFSGINFAHFYKLVGIVLVFLTMVGLIIWVDYRQRQRGIPIKLGGPEPEPNGSNRQPAEDHANDSGRVEPSEYAAQATPPQSHSTDEYSPTPLPQ